MKLLILKSDGKLPQGTEPFTSFFDDRYARRFIKHLKDDPSLCTGCGDNCVSCRNVYDLDRSNEISTVLELPSTLPYYLPKEARDYLPEELPIHDVLVAINIHEELILGLPPLMKKVGGSALIVPSEHPDWVSKWLRVTLSGACEGLGIETAFPKPFCDLAAEDGTKIARFMKEFRIGRPKLKVVREGEIITRAEVKVSAPCGCTYFLAHNIEGAKIDEELANKVSRYWHSYPCTASMKMDYEIGDTILHKGGYIHREAVQEALGSSMVTRR